MKRILLLILLVFGIGNAFGQVNITNNTAKNENFTGYQGTSTFPANWKLEGSGSSYGYRGTNLTGGASGGWYGDNNLAFLGSSNASNGNATWQLRNTSGVSMTGFSLSFTGRMWKSASSSPKVRVYYYVNTSATFPAAGNSGWTEITSCAFDDATANISTGATLSSGNVSLTVANNQYLYLRWIHPGGTSSDNLGWDDITLTPVLDNPVPTTTVSSTALSNFTYVLGNGPSAFQSFNVSGSNLTANLVVTPPTNYEISQTSGGTYVSSAISLTPTSGSIASTPIYVKLKAGLAVGNYNSETISVASTGVAEKTVTLSGSVTAPAPKMVVKGNNVIIVSGDTTPFLTDATDFGSTPINTTVTKTYTIENTGSSDLILPTTNPIILGNGSTGFTHTEPLLHTIPSGGNTTFTVSFNNATPGVFDDSILIASNDNNASSTYTFSIKATATDIPVNPSGTISGTTPACTSTTLTYIGTIPADETYYWQTSATGTSQAQNATSTYAVSASGTYFVRAYKNGSWSAGASAGYAVVINTAVAITANPNTTTVNICPGGTFAALSVTVTGTAPTYQWYKSFDNSNSTPGDDIAVGTNATFTPSNSELGTFYYYVVVSGASPCASVTSNVSGPRTVYAKPATPQGTITPSTSCGTAT